MNVCRILPLGVLGLLLVQATAWSGEYHLGFVREHSLLSYQLDDEMLHVETHITSPYTLRGDQRSILIIRGGYAYAERQLPKDDHYPIPLEGHSPHLRDNHGSYYVQLDDTVHEGRVSRQIRYRFDREVSDFLNSRDTGQTSLAGDDLPDQLWQNGNHYRHTLSYSLGYNLMEHRNALIQMSGKMGGIAAGMNSENNAILDRGSLWMDDVTYGYVYGIEGSLRILDRGRFSLTGFASLEYFTFFSDSSLESKSLTSGAPLIPDRDMSFSLSVQYRF